MYDSSNFNCIQRSIWWKQFVAFGHGTQKTTASLAAQKNHFVWKTGDSERHNNVDCFDDFSAETHEDLTYFLPNKPQLLINIVLVVLRPQGFVPPPETVQTRPN